MRPALQDILFSEREMIQDVLRKMTKVGMGFAIAVDDRERLIGVLTDGDMRRAFLQGYLPDSPVAGIINRSPKVYPTGLAMEQYRLLMLRDRAFMAPLVDEANRVVDYASLSHILLGPSPDIYAATAPLKRSGQETILVTGGAGYIGSVLCQKLLGLGYHVRILDTLLFGIEPIQTLLPHQNVELIMGDIRHIETLERTVFGVDRIVHLAAVVGDPACALKPTMAITSNYFGTKTLIEIAKSYRVKQFIFASSCSVYGANGDGYLSETSPIQPLSLYAETRLKSERDIISLQGDGFSPTILRLATVYGLSPRMRFDLVVNLLTAHAVTQRRIQINGPSQWRPFVHVEDAAEAFVRVLRTPSDHVAGEIFNVGSSDENYTLGSLSKLIQEAVPGTDVVVHENSADLRSYRVSCDKIARGVGFCPTHTVSQGVREIKIALESKRFTDYLDERYSNIRVMEKLALSAVDLE